MASKEAQDKQMATGKDESLSRSTSEKEKPAPEKESEESGFGAYKVSQRFPLFKSDANCGCSVR